MKSASLFGFLVLSCVSLLLAGEAKPPATAASDAQDILFVQEGRPLLIRLHLRIDGRAYQEVWNDFFERLVHFLDRDGNGVLSKEELSHAPSPEQLLEMFLGAPAIGPGPSPEWEEVVQTSEVSKTSEVSLTKLKAYYLRKGAGPLQLELGLRHGSTDDLTEALFRRLDVNKDGKLSKEEILAAPAVLSKLDVDDDELITVQELLQGPSGSGFIFRPAKEGKAKSLPFLLVSDVSKKRPDFEVTIDLAKDPKKDGKITSNTVIPALEKIGNEALLFRFDDVQIEIRRGLGRQARLQGIRQRYHQQFRAVAKKDGLLDSKRAYQPPFAFVALLRLADRDGDGRLSMKELEAFLELQEEAVNRSTFLTISDRGRSLFELLDTDRDGRLGPRELARAWERLAPWDKNHAGFISRKDTPRQFQITIGGQPGAVLKTLELPGYGPAARLGESLRGPLWFRKMDRNRDGYVSRREFLGTEDAFHRIDRDGDGFISVEEAEQADTVFRKGKP